MLATSLAGALRAAQPARIVTRIILARRRQSLHRGHDRVWTGQCENEGDSHQPIPLALKPCCRASGRHKDEV